jgi:type II secretory pathway pseudopilin PulG
MRIRIAGQAGFSLPEAIVAAGILATALVGLAELFAIAIRSNASARDVTFSTVLAAQKLEELRSIEWGVDELGAPIGDVPPSSADFLDRSGISLGTASSPPPGAMYFRRWWVARLPSSPDATLILVVVAGRIRGGAAPMSGEASLVSAKTRTAR